MGHHHTVHILQCHRSEKLLWLHWEVLSNNNALFKANELYARLSVEPVNSLNAIGHFNFDFLKKSFVQLLIQLTNSHFNARFGQILNCIQYSVFYVCIDRTPRDTKPGTHSHLRNIFQSVLQQTQQGAGFPCAVQLQVITQQSSSGKHSRLVLRWNHIAMMECV